MTLQDMIKQMKENNETRQNQYIDKLLDYVDNLSEKAKSKDYTPTTYEREQFSKIANIIKDMENWF